MGSPFGPFPDDSYSLWDKRYVRIVTFFLFGVLLLGTGACHGSGSGPSGQDTISREQFVEAYLRLRQEGLRSPELEIRLQARDRILQELGLTEEDLLTFAEAWGSDADMMQSVWQEVDSLLRQDRAGPRSGAFSGDEDAEEETGIDFRGVGRS